MVVGGGRGDDGTNLRRRPPKVPHLKFIIISISFIKNKKTIVISKDNIQAYNTDISYYIS